MIISLKQEILKFLIESEVLAIITRANGFNHPRGYRFNWGVFAGHKMKTLKIFLVLGDLTKKLGVMYFRDI